MVLLALMVAACSPERALEAKRLLLDVAAGPGPSTLKEATQPPSREPLEFTVEDRQHGGELYRPAGRQGRPLVLVPGVTPQGLDDPRLVAFASSLARVGFLVLVPDIANLRALKVRASDAVPIADAVRYLAHTPNGSTAPRQVALAAISYAAGPAVLAALESDVTPDLAFLLMIGGYYDMTAVVTFFTTGAYRAAPGEPWRYGVPNAYGKWAFVRGNAEVLNTPADRRLLTEIAQRKMDDLAADVSYLTAQLGPEGRSVLALLNNQDPERVPELMAGLPAAIADNMRGLDLAGRDLAALALPVFLLHGRDDPVIPFTESQALADALPGDAARLTLADNLSHVDLTPGGLLDALTLWRASYRLLEARDDMAPAPI
ncbi:MAG: alpha/beta hydrolase family protein [Kiloniellales bacterium]